MSAGAAIKSDFADWFSPMIVKELRQSLRSTGFLWRFLLVQAALVIVIIVAVIGGKSSGVATATTGFFWFFVGLPLTFLLPAAALNSVSGESRDNTLELLLLTRLSARQILVGKWLSSFAQAVLLVTTVLPYIAIRYFTGGIDLVGEFITMASLLGMNALLTALALAISPFLGKFGRVAVPLILFFGIFVIMNLLPLLFFALRGGAGGSSASATVGLANVLLWLGSGALGILLSFEAGAIPIAPPSENHTSRIRLLGLVLLVFSIPFLFLSRDLGLQALLIVAAPLVLIAIYSLLENPKPYPSIYTPFVKRGWLGKIAGFLLYPGWASGFFYVLITFAAYAALFVWERGLPAPGREQAQTLLIFISILGTLLFPAALIQLFIPHFPRKGLLFIGLQVIFALLGVMGLLIHENQKIDILPLFAIFPANNLIFLDELTETDQLRLHLLIVGVVTLLAALTFLVRSLSTFRQIHAIEDAARREIT